MPRNPDIILVWPHGLRPSTVAGLDDYTVMPLALESDGEWVDMHHLATPWFSKDDLRGWLVDYRRLALANGILVARDRNGDIVATAGSIANEKGGMFPRGGQLAWVATAPHHRRRGLSRMLCTMATARLVEEQFPRIFVVTGDDMPEAIKCYRSLGYVPCLYADDQVERWKAICDATGDPFEPDAWPTVEAYVGAG